MALDLRAAVMETLSSRLSISASDLTKMLASTTEELEPVLGALESEGLIHRTNDPTTNEVLLAPTSRGILKVRRSASFAS
jgi:DNA-binding MarR family transcriptional regulator